MPKVKLSFIEIEKRIKSIDFPKVDIILGIADGGVVPASLIAFYLSKPLVLIKISYRDPENNPKYLVPKVEIATSQRFEGKTILVVDEVSVSGKTLSTAKAHLSGAKVISFVLKGQADICAFPEISECVEWPWKL